jgi:putative SOS response-associated peptidase YedK
MCYRTKLNAKISAIEKSFEAVFLEPERYVPKEEINAFTFSENPVISNHAPGEIQFFHWGLIPFWAKNDQIRKNTLNAKIETLEEKPAFRNAVQNRCLVIANGYYEWQWLDEKGKKKQKFLISSAEEEIFAFAGIFSTWTDPSTQQHLNTYSIITTEANDVMSQIHNNKKRMPVMLHKKDCHKWLEGQPTSQFAFPYDVPLKTHKI